MLLLKINLKKFSKKQLVKTSGERGELEKSLIRRSKSVIGVDEVGRGCIAGPVVACCAALDYNELFSLDAKTLNLIRDSKKLSAKQRGRIKSTLEDGIILESYIGVCSAREIEALGIAPATFAAMMKALSQCSNQYDMLLVDGNQKVTGYTKEQIAIVGGDHSCYAIAAASILAKESRDTFMRCEAASSFPNYGFENHVGYGTKAHIASIKEFGICPLHRKNFAPIRNMTL